MRGPQRWTFSRVALIAAAAGCAFSILYLSAPRLASAFSNLRADQVIAKMGRGETLAPKDADALEQGRRSSLAWGESGRAYYDLTTAYLLRPHLSQGLSNSERSRRPRQDDGSVARFATAALKHSPANGRAWLRLAAAENVLNGDTRLKVAALEMSILTAPSLLELVEYRLALMFGSKAFLSADKDPLIFSQIRYFWFHHKERAIRFSSRYVRRIAMFRGALAIDPPAYDLYNQMLKHFFTHPHEWKSPS